MLPDGKHFMDIFTFEIGMNQLLLFVVDEVAAVVDQIDVSAAADLGVFADAGDGTVIEIHHQYPGDRLGQRIGDRFRYGDDPGIFSLNQILYVRRGNDDIFGIGQRTEIPVGDHEIRIGIDLFGAVTEYYLPAAGHNGDVGDIAAGARCCFHQCRHPFAQPADFRLIRLAGFGAGLVQRQQ